MRRSNTRITISIAAAIATLCWASAGWADTVVDLSLEEMATQAAVVVHGTVARVESSWDEDHRSIYTDVDIDVATYLAGDGPPRVRIRQVGGRVGDRELYVSGQPRFRVGQQVVAFLERGEGDDGSFVVLCMSAGLYRVEVDRLTGELVLSRSLEGLARVPGPGRTRLLRQRAARALTLGEIIRRVRVARAAGGGR